jgi:5-methylcytosine-specific restriction endonuclease McrA
MPTWREQGGSTRQWRKTRAYVLRRDRYRCQLRIKGICKVKADCVHHVDGKGSQMEDPSRLAAACTPCNLHIGDPTRPRRDPDSGKVTHHDPPPAPRTAWAVIRVQAIAGAAMPLHIHTTIASSQVTAL